MGGILNFFQPSNLDSIGSAGSIAVTIQFILGSGPVGEDIEIAWTGTIPIGSQWEVQRGLSISATPIPAQSPDPSFSNPFAVSAPSTDTAIEDTNFSYSPGFFNFFTVNLLDSSMSVLATSNTISKNVP